MKPITLCVTPFVKSILSSRYDLPVKVNRSDVLYHYLQGDPIRVNDEKFRKINNELTEQVDFLVNDTLHERLSFKKRNITIGLYLQKVYQHEMLLFIKAQNLAGVAAQRSLKSYFESTLVSEDDYALDSAYTVWKRKKSFFTKKSCAFTLSSVPQKQAKNVSEIPVDFRDILNAANDYYQCGMVNLIAANISTTKHGYKFTYMYDEKYSVVYRHARKVLCYLLKTDAKLNGIAISKIVKIPIRTIQHYISHARTHLDYHQNIQADIQAIRKIYRP
ncbi:MAG: hypothetical protein MK212_19600 [Saprospiraceae bacterium]|nr:hypothetical protein [Saprospiraceae bacterium]